MNSGRGVRLGWGVLLPVLTVAAVAASAAGEKVKLVYKATNGAVARYTTNSSIQVEAQGQKLQLDSKDVEKVTYSVKPTGEVVAERETESSETSVNGQKLPPDDDKDKTTVTIKPDGSLISVVSSTNSPDSLKLTVRLFPTTNPLFPATETELSQGSKWSREFKTDQPAGAKNGKADYEVLAFEKAAGVDSVRVKMTYAETEGSTPLKANGFALIELATGDSVGGEFTLENVPFPGPSGAPVNASVKIKQERTAGSPVGGKVEAAKPKTIDEVVKDYTKLPGMLTLYKKTEAGKDTVYAEIKEEQLNQLFFLQATASTGNAEAVIAGDPLLDILIKFQPSGEDKLLMVTPNIAFTAAADRPIAKAVKRNFPDAWLEQYKIEAKQPERKSLLINISNLFSGDFAQIGRALSGGGLLGLGGPGAPFALDREKSYVVAYKSFPDNLFVQTQYHFMRGGGNATTQADPRSLPLRVNFNMFSLAGSDYQPRVADPRVGFFYVENQDFTKDGAPTLMKQHILRWDVRKKDPNAAMSEPIKPIVFWVDNAIPTEYRQSVKEGILMWNKAFEAIGIKNAVVVNQMPENADWDHADMRYNVIRWSTTQDPPYGAIALFRVNPLTGQILNAGITVDAILTRGAKMEKKRLIDPATAFDPPSTDFKKEPLLRFDRCKCDIAAGGMDQAWFGFNALEMLNAAGQKPDELKYTNDFLRSIVAHEMGHILGLFHNFAASTQFSMAQLKEQGKVGQHGVIGSVMDYVPFNLAALKTPGVDYWTRTIGRYDMWAVQYGYSQWNGVKGDAEVAKLQGVAARGNEPGHAYLNDLAADQFDPAVGRFDLSSEPLDYYTKQIQVARYMLFNLEKQEPKKGRSYWDFTRAFNGLMNVYSSSAASASRYIGGLHMNNNFRGDSREKPVLSPVSGEKQKEALKVLNDYLFAENAFNFPKSYYGKMTSNPFPLTFTGAADFPMKDQFSNLQRNALRRIFSPAVMNRVANNEFKTGNPATQLTLPSMFSSVGWNVWSEVDSRKNINTLRRQLQRSHLDLMTDMVVGSSASADAKMLAWNQLKQIKNQIARAKSGKYDDYTRIHLDESLMRINRALNAQQTIGGGGGGGMSLMQLLLGGNEGGEAPVAPSLKQQ